MIRQEILEKMGELTGHYAGSFLRTSLSNGCINEVYMLKAGTSRYVLKLNSATTFPGVFDAEAKGLTLLGNAKAITVPSPLHLFRVNDTQCLVLEYIESGRRIKDFFSDFGRKMADLHRNSRREFGLDQDNYIGSLPQSNRKADSWSHFYFYERVEPMFLMAQKSGRLDAMLYKNLFRLEKSLPSIFPKEPPALLHGDLWSGNFMTGPDGRAAIYDPAVYYGHREMDIGMAMLFGGFDREFYEAYNEAYPLAKGWQKRTALAQLYPLLVHVNLFGGGYAEQVKHILQAF